MAGNPFFSGRIPKELNESIIKHCEETGKTKTDILIAALSNYLNIPVAETNNKTDDQISKKLADLQERMQRLENTIYQTPVIASDNNNDKGTVVTVVPQSNNLIITGDNNCDNRCKSDKIPGKQYNNESKLKSTKNNDNRDNNTSNHSSLDFKNLETKDVVKKTGISPTQMGRNKDAAFEKAKNQGYSIEPDIKFTNPIEIIQKRKEILIDEEKYKLFCVGTDNKTKPIWDLIYDDNTSYHHEIKLL